MKNHIFHEGQGLGFESLRIKGRECVASGGVLPRGASYVKGMKARGMIAAPVLYHQGGPKKAERPWYVERQHRGLWVTADKCSQGHTIDEARNIVRSCQGYRVVVRLESTGAYYPDAPEVRSKLCTPIKDARGFMLAPQQAKAKAQARPAPKAKVRPASADQLQVLAACFRKHA